jgi:hypothetical protein
MRWKVKCESTGRYPVVSQIRSFTRRFRRDKIIEPLTPSKQDHRPTDDIDEPSEGRVCIVRAVEWNGSLG